MCNSPQKNNPQANYITEIIHKVLGNVLCAYNLQETYVYKSDPWMGILAADALSVRYTYHIIKDKSPGQLVFGRYMILPIKHIEYWKFVHQRKQAQASANRKRYNLKNQPEYITMMGLEIKYF